jgi:FMN phosphatase YigB (HAD superfamily)
MNNRWQEEKITMQEQASWPPLMTEPERISEQTRFRRIPTPVNPAAIELLDHRRERQVYLLTNGTRTILQIARLLAMPSIDVAYLMKRLVDQGYVEAVP